MDWTSLRERVGEWGAMAFCVLLAVAAFYLLLLLGATLSKVILLGVMLICPVIYFVAWLLGRNSGGGVLAAPVRWGEERPRQQVTWSPQSALRDMGRGLE
ncbi:MAG: hypothetical protein GTO63_20015 [Anaerolineae bacterium]|nr:hypothetical protein [Anaerolineae bacterium]NIN97066.1 hypothetical protein [Anaerolineae bacterium]NIQ80015.1 hypothetical protein [Anaerolineae bacterium]